MLTVLDLCSGIGGFALGLERTGGFRTVAFCEANQFCVEVLQSHWPDVPVFRDLRKLRGWHVGYVDCITAGFPCQPYSLAGKQKGDADPRNVWPDVCRLVREILPEWFIGENVPGLDGKHMALDRVLTDLESAGYSAITIEIPACAVDAPHIRKRLFIVANRNGERLDRRGHIGQGRWSQPANSGGHVADCNGARPFPGAQPGICCSEESTRPRDGQSKRRGVSSCHVANRERVGCIGQPPSGTTLTGKRPDGRKAQMGLNTVARAAMWPTARASDHKSGKSNVTHNSRPLTEVATWATVRCQDAQGSGYQIDQRTGKRILTLNGQARNGLTAPTGKGGALNPEFVCWLMMFPSEWTKSGRTVTPSARRSSRK
jgi:DNA-cytosine methyltransferase